MLSRLDGLVTWGRARSYAVLLLAAYALAVGFLLLSIRDGLDPRGKPLGADFVIFYATSALTLEGRAADAYDATALLSAQREVAPSLRELFLWAYPPTFQLLVSPLALVSYAVSLALWLGATGAAYVAAVRAASQKARLSILLALAFPAAFQNAIQGQNGFLTAAILGGGLWLLDRRPVVAGLILGLVAIKPHFGVLLPLILAVDGRWRAFAGAAASATALVVLSLCALGVEPWLRFFEAAPAVARNLESGELPWTKMLSTFAALRLSGVPAAYAYAAHWTAAGSVALMTVLAWRRPGPLELKAALAVCATLVIVPYGFDYDLVLLAVPIAATAAYGLRMGLPPGVRAGLAVAFATPLLGPATAHLTGFNPTPIALVVSFGFVWLAWRDAARR